jgi:hypothetical protein
MDQLVFHSTALEPSILSGALPDLHIHAVYSRFALVEALVETEGLVGAVVDIEHPTPEWIQFLSSARESFPLLPLIVTARGCEGLESIPCVDLEMDTPTLTRRIREHLSAPGQTDRRRHHRFSWPLRACLEGAETVHRIAEISAGGAFLEPVAPVPGPGSRCTIEIEFQNFRLRTTCEILDPRHVSSRSTQGFGVRFVDLSGQGQAFIDRIVNDALAQLLLDPSARPTVPTIGETEDVLSSGDEFSLTI